MTQTPLRLRPKPIPSPPVSATATPTPHRDFARRLMQRRIRAGALGTLLLLLCGFYIGPLQQDAVNVLAVKRVLPVYSVEREDRVISVTFDASWGGDKTMAILDLLDEYNAKATFFLVGIWVDKYPELVKEIAARGHEIGNHSDSHAHFTQISEGQIRSELASCSDKIEALTGNRPTLFRPPYGDYDNKVVTVSRNEGYECVQWSIDSLDWKNRGVSDLVRRATNNVQPGDIILFHNDSQYIVDALPEILAYYRDQGFTMIPAGEILLEGETTIDVQGKQHPAAGN
ncbi:MAG: polysaccharide deacetylase family protein [Clostridia bacterium]|nr:polysaccharide deacetylase family protein [Clostridia bacterium]